jgi:hypothetical protein
MLLLKFKKKEDLSEDELELRPYLGYPVRHDHRDRNDHYWAMRNHKPGLGRLSGQMNSTDSPFMGFCELATATLHGDRSITLGFAAADASQRETSGGDHLHTGTVVGYSNRSLSAELDPSITAIVEVFCPTAT